MEITTLQQNVSLTYFMFLKYTQIRVWRHQNALSYNINESNTVTREEGSCCCCFLFLLFSYKNCQCSKRGGIAKQLRVMKRDTNTSLASWLQNPDKTNVNDKNIPYVLSKLNMLMKVYNQKKERK